MKKNFNLVILPLYRTENINSFSVFNNLDTFGNTLSLDWLNDNLNPIFSKFNISQIYVKGGEISLLSDIYFDILFKLLQIYNKKISITTDFIDFNRSLINNTDIINVLYNFNYDSEQVYKNIKAAISIGKIVNLESIDIFVKDDMLNKIIKLNKLKIRSWKIIPYVKTKFNNIQLYKSSDYKKITDEYIKLSKNMQFNFLTNIEKEKNIYITPNNKFGLSEIDKFGYFSIKEFETLDDLEKNL